MHVRFIVLCAYVLISPTFSGLLSCYAAGIPFFKNTLLGDIFYVGVLFGSFEWAQRRIPSLRPQPVAGV